MKNKYKRLAARREAYDQNARMQLSTGYKRPGSLNK